MDMTHESLLFKLPIIGKGSHRVRKKHFGEGFSTNYPKTVGADFALKEMKIKGYFIKFQIWDLTPEPEFKNYRSIYFYEALGIIIFYNKNDMKSFEEVNVYFDEFKDYGRVNFESFAKNRLIIIGLIENDLNEHISTKQGESLAQSLGMKYYEMTFEDLKIIETILFRMGKAYIDQINDA